MILLLSATSTESCVCSLDGHDNRVYFHECSQIPFHKPCSPCDGSSRERGKNNDSDGGRRPIGTRARKPVGKVVVPKAHSRRTGCHLLVLPSSSFPLSPRECLRKAGAAERATARRIKKKMGASFEKQNKYLPYES